MFGWVLIWHFSLALTKFRCCEVQHLRQTQSSVSCADQRKQSHSSHDRVIVVLVAPLANLILSTALCEQSFRYPPVSHHISSYLINSWKILWIRTLLESWCTSQSCRKPHHLIQHSGNQTWQWNITYKYRFQWETHLYINDRFSRQPRLITGASLSSHFPL